MRSASTAACVVVNLILALRVQAHTLPWDPLSELLASGRGTLVVKVLEARPERDPPDPGDSDSDEFRFTLSVEECLVLPRDETVPFPAAGQRLQMTIRVPRQLLVSGPPQRGVEAPTAKGSRFLLYLSWDAAAQKYLASAAEEISGDPAAPSQALRHRLSRLRELAAIPEDDRPEVYRRILVDEKEQPAVRADVCGYLIGSMHQTNRKEMNWELKERNFAAMHAAWNQPQTSLHQELLQALEGGLTRQNPEFVRSARRWDAWKRCLLTALPPETGRPGYFAVWERRNLANSVLNEFMKHDVEVVRAWALEHLNDDGPLGARLALAEVLLSASGLSKPVDAKVRKALDAYYERLFDEADLVTLWLALGDVDPGDKERWRRRAEAGRYVLTGAALESMRRAVERLQPPDPDHPRFPEERVLYDCVKERAGQ